MRLQNFQNFGHFQNGHQNTAKKRQRLGDFQLQHPVTVKSC